MAIAVGLGLIESPLALTLLGLRAMQLVSGQSADGSLAANIEGHLLKLVSPVLG